MSVKKKRQNNTVLTKEKATRFDLTAFFRYGKRTLNSKNSPVQTDHFSKSQICRFGIESGADVAHECVFGGIGAAGKVNTGFAESSFYLFASVYRNMRVVFAPDKEEFARNFTGPPDRAGIGVLAQFAVMNACAIKADRCLNVRL